MTPRTQHVAVLIIEEMLERAWSPFDLSARSGIEPIELGALFAGERRLDAAMARGLAGAFGTSAEFWLNLDRADHELRRS